MATFSLPDPQPAGKMPRKWARKCERYCWLAFKYFPLAFVYSITTWAVWVETTIGFLPASVESVWIGTGTSLLGIALYILLNWSYTVAVFTNPGGTTNANNGYSSLPTHNPPVATNFTVKANGELRFCKKCQTTKPDRAHHCSTCGICVLKMDHHCPWLANCVGLRNYKAFLLFLIYTSLFCLLCCAVSSVWVWRELLNDGEYTQSLMPVNYVMLAVVAGIIGLVLTGFTTWHIMLASRGQTTIECLEKTRYLSPLRKQIHRPHPARHHGDEGRDYDNQQQNIVDDDVQQEGQIHLGEQRYPNYEAMERNRARARYEEYLDEQDSEKLPSAFDLGWRKNLLHLFGPRKALWVLPICTTTGDGWSWEPSPKWMEARTRIANDREAQRLRERNAGWGEDVPVDLPPRQPGAGRHYVSYPSSPKADKILGRTPNESFSGSYLEPQDAVSMRTLRPRAELDQYEVSSDEDEVHKVERRTLDRKAISGWPRRVGVVTNTLLGNTLARQKDDVRGWDGQDEGVD